MQEILVHYCGGNGLHDAELPPASLPFWHQLSGHAVKLVAVSHLACLHLPFAGRLKQVEDALVVFVLDHLSPEKLVSLEEVEHYWGVHAWRPYEDLVNPGGS